MPSELDHIFPLQSPHISPGTCLCIQQTARLEDADCFADHCPADLELLTQFAFGWQAVAWLQAFWRGSMLDCICHLAGELVLPFNRGIGMSSYNWYDNIIACENIEFKWEFLLLVSRNLQTTFG